MGVKKYSHGFSLTFHPEVVEYPLKIKASRMIFVNSMSDLFHEDISFDLIRKLGYNVKINQSSIGGELKPEVGANGELGYNVKIKQ